MILYDAGGLSKSLEMDDLPLSQITDRIADVRIFYNAEDIIISGPGFLFCCNCERTTYHVEQIGQAAFTHTKTEY